ncbi:hypothetical protein CPB85DRAFT_1433520 [Mucidula mucida]|nr:hypothetical protein CPB85DRAFT_1433520 [Mucidula mucida]
MLVGDKPSDDNFAYRDSSRVRFYSKLFQFFNFKHVILRSGVVENDPSLVGLFEQYFPDLGSLKLISTSAQDTARFLRALSGSFPRLAELTLELTASHWDSPNASLSGMHDLRLGAPCLCILRVFGCNY